MAAGVGCAYLGTYIPPCLSISSLPTLSTPSPSADAPPGTHEWARYSPKGLAFGGNRVEERRLAEFQTPTVFNRDFDFHRSICYSHFEIVKIIIYTLYMNSNVSTIFL